MAAPGKLWVVCAVYNPLRFRSRHGLYHDFARHVRAAGAELVTVEAAFHERDHALNPPADSHHVKVRTSHELWLKENLWNVGISKLPPEAEYVATVDADFSFARPDWAEETVQQLQHHRLVQMFTNISYLDPDHVSLHVTPGFAFLHRQVSNFFQTPHPAAADAVRRHPYGRSLVWAAPGGAWAYRREDLSKVGGLLDCMVLGSGDYFMAMSLLGRGQESVDRRAYHPEYRRHVLDWQDRAERWFRRDFGHVPGTVLHHWHGKLGDRRYVPREDILVKHQFNPRTDLARDCQGVWQLHDDGSVRFTELRDAIRDYFRLRNEDSIDP
jgi:hypothetical protein